MSSYSAGGTSYRESLATTTYGIAWEGDVDRLGQSPAPIPQVTIHAQVPGQDESPDPAEWLTGSQHPASQCQDGSFS